MTDTQRELRTDNRKLSNTNKSDSKKPYDPYIPELNSNKNIRKSSKKSNSNWGSQMPSFPIVSSNSWGPNQKLEKNKPTSALNPNNANPKIPIDPNLKAVPVLIGVKTKN